MRLARSVSRSIFVVSTLSLLAMACGGKSIANDDLTSTPDPTDPTTPAKDAGTDAPKQCNGVKLACDPGDESVGSEAACGNADYCYSRRGGCPGTLLWCAHRNGAQCGALPSCNPGDVEVTDINTCTMKGVSCYPVTECDYTIHCYTP